MCKYDNQFILCCVNECMRHQEHLHFLTKPTKKASELEKNLVEGKSLETLLQLWEALTFFIFKSIANGLQILILMSGQIAQSYVCPLLSNQHSLHKTPFHIKWITGLIMVKYEWRGMIHQPSRIQMHTNTKPRRIVSCACAYICLIIGLFVYMSLS